MGLARPRDRDRPADRPLRPHPREEAGDRLLRDPLGELHGHGRAAGVGARSGRRALPDRDARRIPEHRERRSPRPRSPREAEGARRADAGALGLRSPLLDRGCGTQHARPPADALERGGAAPRRRPGEGSLGLPRAAAHARERVDVRRVHVVVDAGVGVLRPPDGEGRLRDAPRRQQRLRQRVQPRVRSRGVPRRDRPGARDAVPPRRPHEQGHAHHRHPQRPCHRPRVGALRAVRRTHGQRRDPARVGRGHSLLRRGPCRGAQGRPAAGERRVEAGAEWAASRS